MKPRKSAVHRGITVLLVVITKFSCLSPSELRAQIVRVSVNLVQLEVVVTDSRGRHVAGLEPVDFEVLDGGRSQEVVHCTYVAFRPSPSSTPAAGSTPLASDHRVLLSEPKLDTRRENVQRTVVILIDDGSLTPQTVPAVRKALKTVVTEQIQPGDLTAVVRTMSGEGALEGFTQDKAILYASADALRWIPGGRGASHMSLEDAGAGPARMWSFSKALKTMESVLLELRDLPGRKAVIFVSQEWPGAGSYSLASDHWREPVATLTGMLVDEALRAGVTIYTIDPSALDSLSPGADFDLLQYYHAQGGTQTSIDDQTARELPHTYQRNALDQLRKNRLGLQELAAGTGGFMVADTNDISGGVARVLDDLQGYYVIDFKPRDPDRFFASAQGAPPPFHPIKVRVKRPGMHVRYEAGFLGKKDEVDAGAKAETGIAKALNSPFSASDIRLGLTAIFNMQPGQSPEIDVLLNVDARDLTFASNDGGRRRSALELLARTVDEKGLPSESIRKDVTLQLPENEFREASQMGLLYQTSIVVSHPGYYEVRIAVEDSKSGKLGNARQYVEVPDLSNGRLAVSGLLAYAPPSERTRAVEAPGTAARRVFERKDTLDYVCQLFNAAHGSTETDARILRDGKPVMGPVPGQLKPISPESAAPLLLTGAVPLQALEPGAYVLQIIARDATKKQTASRWTDFEIVP